MKKIKLGKTKILLIALIALFVQILFVTPTYALEGENGQETVVVEEKQNTNNNEDKKEVEKTETPSNVEAAPASTDHKEEGTKKEEVQDSKKEELTTNNGSSNEELNNGSNSKGSSDNLNKEESKEIQNEEKTTTNESSKDEESSNNNINNDSTELKTEQDKKSDEQAKDLNNDDKKSEEINNTKSSPTRSGEPTDLRDYITSVTINNADDVTEDGYTVRKNHIYQMTMTFKEGGNHPQFNNHAELHYTLPDGFREIENKHDGTFDITVTGTSQGEVVVRGNTYSIQSGVLTVNWNYDDPHINDLFCFK